MAAADWARMIDVVLDASKVRKRAEEEEKEVAAKATTSSVVLAWRDLTVSVSSSQGGQARKVLHGLTGYAEPGRLLAVMGPSGSGKSTLLDSLAGRLARNAEREGSVWINGQKQKASFGTALERRSSTQRSCGCLMRCRWPRRSPWWRRRSWRWGLANAPTLSLGIGTCGGLAALLLRPHLLFLDEPTSGLDSASAFFVTKTLQKLARDGRTVLASIHQPSSEVFALFDDLFLLANGRTVYFGESRSAHQYFSAAGFPCPPLRNPSDHFLRAINSDFDRVKQTLKGSYIDDQLDSSDPLNKITATEVVAILLDSYPLSTQAVWADSKVNEYTSLNGTVSEPNGSQASFLTQSLTLTCRSFVNMTRDIGYYWLRLAIYMLLTLCIGTIYFKVGSTYESIAARASCMAYVAGFLTFMSIGGFPSFVEDMKVFARERLNGHYGVAAFVIANTLSSLPFLFLICFVSGFICYYMVGLNPGFDHFIYFLLILFCSVSVVESLMMAVASVVPNFLMGIITGAGIQGFFMLVAGFFRLPNEIPKVFWKYPVSYLSFHMFSLQGMYQNDFLGVDFSNKFPALPTIPGRLILSEFYQVNMRRSKWANLAVVFSMIVIYRLFFFAMIKAGEDLRALRHTGDWTPPRSVWVRPLSSRTRMGIR
ncbi:ATP-binding cassette transporter [Selaginella moellendorffii]|uniref:ATP-binding cassette transporter n=1 Tax=Selaginella moellendorffii TaxID=88036 RepID=D8QYN0_SELML|nr:ATP-binding cassette transporter [Selaginella moellendorffii]